MNTLFEIATRYAAMECTGCAVSYAITCDFQAQRVKDHKTFHCPNGCVQHYEAESKEERLQRCLNSERDDNNGLRYRIDHANRSRAALKGQVTKIKRRVGKGICPCCRRNFANLKRHMEGQHPNWSEESA